MNGIDLLAKLKVIQTRAGGYAAIGSFIILLMAYMPKIEAYIPIPLFLGMGGLLLLFDYRYLFPKEGLVTAEKNPFNLEVRQRLERIENFQNSDWNRRMGGVHVTQ